MKSTWLVPILILIGVLCLGLSLFVSTRTDKSLFGQKPLARIEQGLGQVFVFRKNMTVKEKLVRKSFLYSGESVESDGDGDAVLEFDSAYRIRILENSLITLTDERGKSTIIIKRGDIQVENYGQEGSVFVSREGVRWTATDYEMVYKKRAKDQDLPDTAASDTPASESTTAIAKPSMSGLSPEYIQDVLKSQRNSFFKCYTQLLQKTPGITGQASLSFTIERTGKVHQPSVASSNIADTGFRKCLTEALLRIEFKSFSGDAITTVFPLKFE